MFITNEILVASLKEIAMEKVIMEQKVREYEKIYNELETQIRPKRKKRRTASEIQKNFLVSIVFDWYQCLTMFSVHTRVARRDTALT